MGKKFWFVLFALLILVVVGCKQSTGNEEYQNPENPGITDTPGNPENPGITDTPENPENPGITDTPENPENPGITDTPENPENPGITDTPEYVETDYQISTSELEALLQSLDSTKGPYNITVTDESPDLSKIKTALASNNSVKVNLDISACSGLAKIGDSAFQDCTSLISVKIPEGITSITSSAFSGCTSLTSINIPDSVTSIYIGAFTGCSSLTNFDVDKGNSSYSASEDGKILLKNKTELFAYPSASGKVTIPTGIITIQDSAFKDCTSVTNISISNSVTTINSSAFMGCTSLTSITIPSNVTAIGRSVFKDCTALKKIHFNDPYGWCYTASYPNWFGKHSGNSYYGMLKTDDGTNANFIKMKDTYYWYKIGSGI
ncbi:MAG: leucine-rich repeat protein [Spirochaetaceae bacterium]|nr:leucine-rich repeat protein [Spirochaetaceae bacterium]